MYLICLHIYKDMCMYGILLEISSKIKLYKGDTNVDVNVNVNASI